MGDVKIVGISNSSRGKKTNWKVISAVIGIVVLALGIIAGIILVSQQQDIREKAQVAYQCPAGQACPVPGDPSYMGSCDPGEVDSEGSDPAESYCDRAGRVEICGGQQYCCPEPNGVWVRNMTLCSVASTPTSTATATATSTSTSTARSTATSTSKASSTATSKSTKTATPKSTATAKATAKSTATAFPVPETGTDLPTILGAGFGIVMILVSLGLAL